jgi:hypothetical protein
MIVTTRIAATGTGTMTTGATAIVAIMIAVMIGVGAAETAGGTTVAAGRNGVIIAKFEFAADNLMYKAC